MEYKIPTSKIIELLDLRFMFISSSTKKQATTSRNGSGKRVHQSNGDAFNGMRKKIPHQFIYSIVMEIIRIVQQNFANLFKFFVCAFGCGWV